VPFVPGTSRGLESFEQAQQVAARIGYPVMFKAAAGGGGKGIRLVQAPAQLKSSLEEARSEAERSFGDGEIYIEKAIVNPRHIEMQVLADEHGNTVYLGERECFVATASSESAGRGSLARSRSRHATRMGEVAVRVAQAANYTNAGTVEFLVDQQKNFYFLEMNTGCRWSIPSPNWSQASIWCTCRSASPRERSCRSRKPTFICAAMPWNAASTPKIPTTTTSPAPERSRS